MKKGFHNNRIKTRIALLAVLLLSLLMPAAVFADSGGYTTESFNVNVVTDENHVFHVDEEITVDFNEYRHGIYRYIPGGGSQYCIKNISVKGYEYEAYVEDGNDVIKIGSADEYVYGTQVYKIHYDIVGYKDKDTAKDTLAIDLLPTGWGTAIDSAKATITFPKRIKDIKVYSGQYKDTEDEGYFLVSQDGKSLTAVSRDTLPKGVGLTIRADLPEGYWVNPLDREASLPKAYGLLGALAALMLVLWAAVGRDKAVIKPVEFYPPDGMDPLQVSYIANDKVESGDIAALFMYFASKGYLKVIQEDKKKFRLQYLQKIADREKHHAKQIFAALFCEGGEVQLKNLPSRLGEVAAGIEKDVKSSFGKDMRAFTKSSKAGRAIGTFLCLMIPLIAGWICTYVGFAGLGIGILTSVIALLIGLFSRMLIRKADAFGGKKKPVKMTINAVVLLALILAQAVILFTFFPILAGVFLVCMLVTLISTMFVRQRANNDIYGKVMGFREFIRTAEQDRLKTLCEEDPEYYFNIMPYACVFGMSNKWADKFSNFKIPQPSWYDGYGVFDPYFPHHMFIYSSHGVSSTVGDYYKAISADMVGDIASSGGGGGFSGGGFGGGGGGSW